MYSFIDPFQKDKTISEMIGFGDFEIYVLGENYYLDKTFHRKYS